MEIRSEGGCTENEFARKGAVEKVSMKRTGNARGRAKAYWWNESRERMRHKCNEMKREVMKLRASCTIDEMIYEEVAERYALAKSQCKKAIKQAKGQFWRDRSEDHYLPNFSIILLFIFNQNMPY